MRSFDTKLFSNSCKSDELGCFFIPGNAVVSQCRFRCFTYKGGSSLFIHRVGGGICLYRGENGLVTDDWNLKRFVSC